MTHSPADLLLLVEESAGHGTITPDEHQLLVRSLQLSGLDAAAAMTPRPGIVAVDADRPADDVARIAHRTGRSRLVVHDGDLDHVLGVLHAKDVLLLDPDSEPPPPPATSPERDWSPTSATRSKTSSSTCAPPTNTSPSSPTSTTP